MIDFNEKKGFICDMDGVIYHGNRILPGVVEFIDWLKANDKGYLFLTNNSGCTPKELNQKLARMGLDVPEEHFYTSALATAAFIKEQSPGCSAYVIGEAGLLNALYDAGITMNDITIITEFDPEKVEKFITKVIVQRWTVTFVFYNGVEITRAYTNGPSGNQVGWKQKKEVAAWQ